jgi:hypothetical protein
VSSPNPGISAAGEAAGRTALNPSTGPAAIGGMVVPGESEPEPPTRRRVPSAAEDRLATVVSDISKLATAMGALSLSRHPEEAARREQYWGRSGGGPYAMGGGAPGSVPGAESVHGGSTAKRVHELGTPGAATTGIGGYTTEPAPSTDPPRQAASRHPA